MSLDDERRRVAYSILDSPFKMKHHNASMQVGPSGASGARFIWTTDVKPDEVVPALSEAIDGAIESFKETLR